MHVSAQMVHQWICEWLLTSAVISAVKCAWSTAVDPLDIHHNLVANTRSKQSAMQHFGRPSGPPRVVPVNQRWRMNAQLIQRPAAVYKASVLSWLTQAGPPWPQCWQIPWWLPPRGLPIPAWPQELLTYQLDCGVLDHSGRDG